MRLSDLQAERNVWAATNFPDDTLVDSVMGAVEELGELAHHLLKRKQGIRGDAAFHTAEIEDAVADCVIFLAGVATHEQFDFGHAVQKAWDRVKERDWTIHPQEGVPS
jgi:NTP pyrophosphatase (non-canonical NTP hydrolase)